MNTLFTYLWVVGFACKPCKINLGLLEYYESSVLVTEGKFKGSIISEE
jgi:hypothetical protein